MESKIKKIFFGWDFRGNPILNAKIPNAPEKDTDISNKKFVDDSLKYDTTKANTYKNPFKFWWITNVQSMSLKTLLDNLLFPRLAPEYENPILNSLDVKSFSEDLIVDGKLQKYLIFYDKQVTLNFLFDITNRDRNSNGTPYLKILNPDTGTFQTFNAEQDFHSGIISATFIPKPNLVYTIERNYLAAEVKQDSYNQNSIPSQFSIPYTFSKNINELLNDLLLFRNSPLISEIQTEEIYPDYPDDLSGITVTPKVNITLPANNPGIFNILIPIDLTINTFEFYDNQYPIYCEVHSVDSNQNLTFLEKFQISYKDLIKVTNGDMFTHTVNNVSYTKFQYNFGIYTSNVVLKLKFCEQFNTNIPTERTKVLVLTLNKGKNRIKHNLKSINIFSYMRIYAVDNNPMVDLNKIFMSDFEIVDSDNIDVNSSFDNVNVELTITSKKVSNTL